MKLALTAGTTSQIVHVFIQDSTVTTGAGKTALIHSGITAYYVRAGGTLTALTMETIAALGTWASTGDNYLGFKLLHNTNAPGGYELHLPNNILAAGSSQVTIFLQATGAAPCPLEIQLAPVPADVVSAHGAALTEAGGHGRLAAALSTFGNVATPVFTAASVNQTADGDLKSIKGTALPAESVAGRDAAALGKFLDVASPVLTAACVNQTSDNPTADAIGTDAASKVLATPAQKLATDASGRVTVGSNADKTGYALAVSPPTAADIKTALEADGSKLDHVWEMTEDDTGVRRLTVNALEQAPVTDAAAAHGAIDTLVTTVGVAGVGLTNLGDTRIANLNATVGSRSSHSAADVKTAIEAGGGSIAAIKAKTDTIPANPTSTSHLPTGFSTVTVTDAKIDANASVTLTEENVSSIAAAVISALDIPSVPEIAAGVEASTVMGEIAAAAAIAAGGSGAVAWTYTVTDSGRALPIGDVEVWLTTDLAGSNVVARTRTSAAGVASFRLTAGTYYVWRYKAGYAFSSQPDQEEIV